MSGKERLRAASASGADVVQRATRRATRDTAAPARAAVPRTTPEPLGRDFAAAMRTARARVAELYQAELLTPAGIVRYVDTGTGPPVLLVHGIFGGADAALRQLGPLVPRGCRLVAPSRFGYLGSALPADASPERQADVFAALLDDLGIRKTAVVAVSAGAACALRFAIRYPERVTALVLVSANGPGSRRHRRPLPRALAAALWGSDRLMWLARRRLPRLLGVRTDRPLGPADRARVVAEVDGLFPVAGRVAGAVFDAFVANQDIGRGYRFGRVTAPTLIVRSWDDPLTSNWGAVTLYLAIPNARLVVVDDGGHLVLGDHPEVAVEIEALLRATSD